MVDPSARNQTLTKTQDEQTGEARLKSYNLLLEKSIFKDEMIHRDMGDENGPGDLSSPGCSDTSS